MATFVGTSAWKYPRWRGDFYPHRLRQADELVCLGRHLNRAEINGSFYSLETPVRYARWRDATPVGFVFAVKGGRFITHLKRLRDPEVGLANFFASGPLALDRKLGPFLWQLHAALLYDPDLLEAFLALLPRSGERPRSWRGGPRARSRTSRRRSRCCCDTRSSRGTSPVRRPPTSCAPTTWL